MDYEKKYNEALERAKKFEEKYGGGYAEYIFPELAETEDERILRVISEAVITFFSDYANDFEDEDRDAALAWLEKQKEQKNTSASTMAPSCWEVEQKEQKPKAKAKSPLSPHELYDAKIEGISQGRQDVLDHPEQFGLQKPAEWSEEDKEKIVTISEIIEHCTTIPYSGGTLTLNKEYKKELLCFIKSLRPSWKPSEEQMEALEAATVRYQSTGLESLYEELKKL